jgi:transcriptional regulator with XRE-family HTH domain
MNGQEFKRIRKRLKLSAAALGHALGYEGSDANIARTIYRLESGRPVPRPIARLLEMFDAFGVPRAWAGETAQRQHDARPTWSGRPTGANGGATERIVEIRHRLAAELSSRFQEAAQSNGATNHGQETGVDMAARPAGAADHGQTAISHMASRPHGFRAVPAAETDAATEPAAVPSRSES